MQVLADLVGDKSDQDRIVIPTISQARRQPKQDSGISDTAYDVDGASWKQLNQMSVSEAMANRMDASYSSKFAINDNELSNYVIPEHLNETEAHSIMGDPDTHSVNPVFSYVVSNEGHIVYRKQSLD